MKLAQAVVLTLDGPGDEWLMLCRGTRAPVPPKQTRSPPRRRPRASGHA